MLYLLNINYYKGENEQEATSIINDVIALIERTYKKVIK